MNKVMISIIMPSYNAEQFLENTLNSVVNQTFTDWELIIIDDCSSDNSVEFLQNYISQKKQITLLQLKTNSGPAVARNRGIEYARGKYIAFLDADDYWHKQKLEKQLYFMKNKDIALSFTAYDRVEEDSGIYIDTQSVPNRIDYKTLLKQNIMGCLTVMYDTHKLGKIYMPNIARRQDYALWLKILKQVPYAYGLNESLAYYRVRTFSVSSNKVIASSYHWKVLRDIEKLPIYKAIYYFGWYTYKSIMKYK